MQILPGRLDSVQRHLERRPRVTLAVVVVTIVTGLLMTAVGALVSRRYYHKEAEYRFASMAEQLRGEVQRRMSQSLYGLKGARGMYAARGNVSRAEFRAYTDSRHIKSEFPGVIGFGFIERVMRPDLDAFLARERADAAPDFEVKTSGDARDLYVIKFIDPLSVNSQAWGYDVGAEATRRAAVERAVRTGEPAITDRIALVQDDRKRAGFLYLLPVFRNGSHPTTPDERYEALAGLVYAPVVIDDVFAGLLSGTDGMIDVEVYETGSLRKVSLLLDADNTLVSADDSGQAKPFGGRLFHHVADVSVGGRDWTLAMTSTRAFERSVNDRVWVFVAIGGGLVTALLSGIVMALGRSRTRALKLAGEMTASLRASEAEARRLAMVASRTSNAVVITDSEERIQWVNEGFTRLTGFTFAEVQGRKPGVMLQGPGTDRATVAEVRKAVHECRAVQFEILNYGKNRAPYWLAVEVQPLRDESGAVTGFMAIESDITARKVAEQESRELNAKLNMAIEESREAAAKAEQANVAKSQFLAMMSHEIRTPMNGVIGMTSLLLDTPLNAQQREFAEIVRSSGETLLSLINDILDFSKIESGRMDLENEVFSLVECVESALDLFAAKAAQKGIDLLYQISDGVPHTVRGDITRLRQILVNLVGNALKFTERGEIELTIHLVSLENETAELRFGVRDTGIGIPKDAQARLFRSFTQVDASTTRKYGGTGLGLAISRRLSEIMDGRMWIESETGRGSTFFFTIKVGAPASASVVRPSSGLVTGKRLLVVENNAAGRRMLSALADKWGMPAVVEENGPAALARIRAGERFDVAVVDMLMPEMDGVMLARELRNLPNSAGLPLILLSSIGRQLEPADAALFAAVLNKPTKPSQLVDAIARVFGAVETVQIAKESASPAVSPDNGALRILLAEDNPVNQKVVLHMLARNGYRADTAANGLEALAAIRRQPYDVVLMDMQMPEMDGLEATRQIRAGVRTPNHHPWIIALTANAMESDRELCVQAGMNDYLSKPTKNADLVQVLERAKEMKKAGTAKEK